MTTPIADFVKNYALRDLSRFHMPGHKGKALLGCESLDITEIDGADVLYSAGGIIDESESNASALFGTKHSFYSTEGSSLAIKAMLALIKKRTPTGERTTVLAARNVHKAFIYACALLDTRHLCKCVQLLSIRPLLINGSCRMNAHGREDFAGILCRKLQHFLAGL